MTLKRSTPSVRISVKYFLQFTKEYYNIYEFTNSLNPLTSFHVSMGSGETWILGEISSKYFKKVDFPEPIFPSTATLNSLQNRSIVKLFTKIPWLIHDLANKG